jgi:hypothetical protein
VQRKSNNIKKGKNNYINNIPMIFKIIITITLTQVKEIMERCVERKFKTFTCPARNDEKHLMMRAINTTTSPAFQGTSLVSTIWANSSKRFVRPADGSSNNHPWNVDASTFPTSILLLENSKIRSENMLWVKNAQEALFRVSLKWHPLGFDLEPALSSWKSSVLGNRQCGQ